MTTPIAPLGRGPDQVEAPQYGGGTILVMLAWPAAWFTLLIYAIGRQFVSECRRTTTDEYSQGRRMAERDA
jgi:hypothetical protein